MKHVVSVSLGSSRRNKIVEVKIAGERFRIARIGTDGSLAKFAHWVRELDGQVDVLCFGGLDIYLYCGCRRYAFREALMLAKHARCTPVVDGSGWKNYVEPEAIAWIMRNGIIDLASAKVLLVSSVDRAGMARALHQSGCQLIFGDLAFALGFNIGISKWWAYLLLGSVLVPVITKLPIAWVYPVGEKQVQITPKYANLYAWADVIAGDFLLIRRYLPKRLDGKTVLTNTTTSEDAELLRARGLKRLITTTPEFDGRTFGGNVMEGIVVALMGKHPDELSRNDYREALALMDWQPNVVEW